jgi:PTS system nitrogen regulatory IIA component
MPEIMTTKELAAYLKMHQITIRKYAEKGEIPSVRIGRDWRFDKKVIDEWLREGHKGNLQVSRKGK